MCAWACAYPLHQFLINFRLFFSLSFFSSKQKMNWNSEPTEKRSYSMNSKITQNGINRKNENRTHRSKYNVKIVKNLVSIVNRSTLNLFYGILMQQLRSNWKLKYIKRFNLILHFPNVISIFEKLTAFVILHSADSQFFFTSIQFLFWIYKIFKIRMHENIILSLSCYANIVNHSTCNAFSVCWMVQALLIAVIVD